VAEQNVRKQATNMSRLLSGFSSNDSWDFWLQDIKNLESSYYRRAFTSASPVFHAVLKEQMRAAKSIADIRARGAIIGEFVPESLEREESESRDTTLIEISRDRHCNKTPLELPILRSREAFKRWIRGAVPFTLVLNMCQHLTT
jgi:hypothetical protein